jgi:predicted  nucleic acid-binding Zn-ribbon protein
MNELRLEYKRETGNRPEPDEYGLYQEDYVEWLESKINDLQSQLSAVSIDYKSEYDDAVYEIGQLQDQLSQAEDEIRELNYEIKIRPQ